MPTVLRRNGFRVYFYSNEPNEPPHVHVDRAGASAKLWLGQVRIVSNVGFSTNELADVLSLVRTRRDQLLKEWHGYFGPT